MEGKSSRQKRKRHLRRSQHVAVRCGSCGSNNQNTPFCPASIFSTTTMLLDEDPGTVCAHLTSD
jgi:hypothetical protein